MRKVVFFMEVLSYTIILKTCKIPTISLVFPNKIYYSRLFINLLKQFWQFFFFILNLCFRATHLPATVNYRLKKKGISSIAVNLIL